MTNPILNGPQAPESNPPIEPQFFVPNNFTITAIALGRSTTVTLANTFYGSSPNYVIGQQVRFLIPSFYGASPLSGQQGLVIALPAANQVTVNIDTSINYNAFKPTPSYGPTPPQLLPIGDVNTGTINSSGRLNNGTFIPGAFINISPE